MLKPALILLISILYGWVWRRSLIWWGGNCRASVTADLLGAAMCALWPVTFPSIYAVERLAGWLADNEPGKEDGDE